MQSWPLHEAERHFGDVLEAGLKEGPQVVAREGVEMAVLVPIGQWRKLNDTPKPSLKDLLLDPAPRSDELATDRTLLVRRPPPDFE